MSEIREVIVALSMERIRLADVDLEKDLFSPSYPAVPSLLAASIRRKGVLRPPLLVVREGRLVVASGFRRTLAAKMAGFKELPCRLMGHPPPPDALLFLENLEDNLSSRSLHYLERALAVKRMEKDIEGIGPAEKEEYLALLGIRKGEREKERFLGIAALDEGVKRFLFERDLPERIAHLFSGLSREDAEELIEAAEGLRLTTSQIRELAEFGIEIADREGVSPREVIRSLKGPGGIDEGEGPRKRETFIARLRERRWPDFTKLWIEIESCLSGINGVPGLKATPPYYLEGDTFNASLSFRKGADLENQARALMKFAESRALARAVDLLGR